MNVFITGTDTDAGKTALTGLLLAALQDSGIDAVPMKPVQTGCVDGVVPDLDFYERVTGRDYSNHTMHAPYLYEPACSPHLAAKLAKRPIELARIAESYVALDSAHEMVVVEGAGGVMVPLNESETMLDLMTALDLPIIIAARPGLGTINHTLLTVAALRQGGLNVLGVVIVVTTDGELSYIEQDNVLAIEKYGEVPVLGVLPYLAEISTEEFSYRAVSSQLAGCMESLVSLVSGRS